MGCICSKGAACASDNYNENETEQKSNRSAVQPVAPFKKEEVIVEAAGAGGGADGSVRQGLKQQGGGGGGTDGSVRQGLKQQGGGGGGGTDGSVRQGHKPAVQANVVPLPIPSVEGEKNTIIVERPASGHHKRRATVDMGINGGGQPQMSRIISMPNGAEGEQIVAGWPSWLTSVAGEAVQGWVPRRADSFEKLDKIGQGTYSSVYKARDLESGNIVAMKKVRFVNMDPESVRFMAREIYILRKLDHPNVMKLIGLVTSRMSCSLYLVFEYMEHDLAGLTATRGFKFTEPQIKCYMQQILRGLEHCHSRGILHRDIKGSNLLIDNNGNLKIGDFGLANFFHPDHKQPLTSRVVTLWYRAPELLLGATDYGVSVDLWSTGCILAELFAGKPIMPGRTEVEQMHKIFKLCGSPSEDYWRKSKLPHATSFKPQHPYKRCLAETFKDFPSSARALIDVLLAMEPEDRGSASSALKSEFFTTTPLPCDPSILPKYPPSKEFDAKLRDEEARRYRAEATKGRGPESVRRGSIDHKEAQSPEFISHGQVSLQAQCTSYKYDYQEDGGSGFPLEPPRGAAQNGYSHTNSMIHPSAAAQMGPGQGFGSARNNAALRTQRSQVPRAAGLPNPSHKKEEQNYGKESATGYKPKKRIHYSGPLMPPGGNIEDMLKEHERQIQQAVRNARLDKNRTQVNFNNNEMQQHHRRNQ